MKNKAGKIGGLLLGVIGFLVVFKLIVIDHTSPSDELAPGIVVIVAIMNGLLFAFIGQAVQKQFDKRGN